jgi:Zn-dependent peptidase ImmA (M78 family)
MKIPKYFNIFGQKVKIKKVDLGPQYLGLYHSDKKTISINSSITDESELDHTVIHEFIHSVIDRCSLNQVVTYPSEEVLVDMLTKALLENFNIKSK